MPNLDSSAIDSYMEPTYSETLELFSSIETNRTETNRSESNSIELVRSNRIEILEKFRFRGFEFNSVRLKKQEKF